MNEDRLIQIQTICKTLKAVLKRNPSQRVAQVIGNIFGADDHYHRTDEELLEGLQNYPDSNIRTTQGAMRDRMLREDVEQIHHMFNRHLIDKDQFLEAVKYALDKRQMPHPTSFKELSEHLKIFRPGPSETEMKLKEEVFKKTKKLLENHDITLPGHDTEVDDEE